MMYMNRNIFLAVFVFTAFIAEAQQSFVAPEKGFTSWQPASEWEHALLSGNGIMGAMVMGEPHDETIILSHALLYLPRKRSASLIDQASKLDTIRKLLLMGKYQEAAKIPVALRQQQGYHDERDPFIPAFDVNIRHEPANITRYQRSVNFQTGEAIVDWQDDIGTFQRKLFVSRADNLIVLSIKGTAKINCSIQFERRPVEWNQWNFVNEHMQFMQASAEGNEWLHYQAGFKIKNEQAIHGYEGCGKLLAINGTVAGNGSALRVQNADEVLLLIRILPLYNSSSQQASLKQELSAFDTEYNILLSKHAAIHGDLFNRVALDLGGNKEDRLLHSEELLLRSRQHVPLAMIERAFDAGRYNIISATGIHPPNLQGIWSGTWTAPWAGSMTNDGNLPAAVSINLPGNMPELMRSYFNYHKRLLNDYRTSARALFNCRGIHIPAQATTTGIDTDFGAIWCLTFWTGGAGWAADFFWDYYQYTLDKKFLQEDAYPFMKEAALFYEDFLQPGPDGKFIFNPSYSPENNPANSNSQAAINATMDIMIAKQLIRNCIEAAGILQTDAAKVKLWQSMLEKMPGYELDQNNTLREWMWKDLKENHRHRHASHLYALFNEIEPEFKSNAQLRAGAMKVIEEKMKFRAAEGGGEMSFGLVQLGSAAAHLGQAATCLRLVEWLSSKYWAKGMGSYHNVHDLFNTDISGGLPYLITQMLAYSEKGMIVLLPALPEQWKEGSVKGLLLRGNIVLTKLTWNEEEVELSLKTPVPQKVRLQFPFDVEIAGRQKGTELEIQLAPGKEMHLKVRRVRDQQASVGRIQLNQVGFYPNAPKVAVVTGKTASDNFYILEYRPGGDTVFTGVLSREKQSLHSSTLTRLADFTAFSRKGKYIVWVPGVGRSYPFTINTKVHERSAAAVLKAFYFQRSDEPLSQQYAGIWKRATGHPDTQVLVHPSAASSQRMSGAVIKSPGGWYDAGDYNKYIVNSGITMGTLLAAFEDFPAYFKELMTNIPESKDAVPDILNEVIYNLRWMLTMQDPEDGGVYHKLTNAAFDGMVMPGVTKDPRYVVQKGTAATLDFVAVTAQASRVLRQFEKQLPGLADSCLKAAIAAWQWAQNNPHVVYSQRSINARFDPDITTGEYGDREFSDEWLWAAAELFATTKDKTCFDTVLSKMKSPATLPSWANVALLGYYTLIRCNESLPAYANAAIKQMQDSVLQIADNYLAKFPASAFATVMGQSARDFVWGSNAVAANQGILLINAYFVSRNKKYLHAALSNLDYIFGRNATGYCFVTGIGSKSPMHPHHRPSEADGVADPVPGLLAGGPNPGRQDKCEYPFTEPETAYTDVACSYASNEIAINWNAPLVYLLGAMEALAGKQAL